MPKTAKKPISLCKINHITDAKIVQKLYEASAAGVSIRLLVRGNCSLVAGLGPKSDRIEIRGIIDRYLEHARILIFCNGGDEQYYIGSADWMPRNIDHRIEAYAPVYDPEIRRELKTIVEFGLADNVAARIVDGTRPKPHLRQRRTAVPFATETIRTLSRPQRRPVTFKHFPNHAKQKTEFRGDRHRIERRTTAD